MKRFMQNSPVDRPMDFLLILVLFLFTCAPVYADQERPAELIAQEIRYISQEAGEVLLVWGINDWKRMPDEQRPAGTLIKNSVMHTPMTKHESHFAVTLYAEAGTIVDFGFLVTRTKNGIDVLVWEGDGKDSFHQKVRSDHVISVSSEVSLLQSGKTPPDKWDSIPYLIIPILCFFIALKAGIVVVKHRDKVWRRRVLLPAFKKPRRPSTAGNAGLIGISLLIGFALTELTLYLMDPDGGFGAARPLEWIRQSGHDIDQSIMLDPTVGLRPRPNRGLYDENGTVANSYPVKKSPGTVRILVLGSAAVFEGQLVEALRHRYAERDVEVWNGGIPSYGTVQTIDFYQQHQAKIQADKIILFIVSGDIETTPITYRDGTQNIVALMPYLPTSSLNSLLFTHSRFYRLLIGMQALISTEAEVLEEIHAKLSDLAASLKRDRKDFLVVLLPLLYPEEMWTRAEQERRNAIINMLETADVRYVDLLPPLRIAINDKLDVREHAGSPFAPTTGLARRFVAYLDEQDHAKILDARVDHQ
jgi:hypothetical protein